MPWGYARALYERAKMPPIMTRRRARKKMALQHSTKGQTGMGFVSGCPFCPWVKEQKYSGPAQVRVGTAAKVASCRNGHVWSLV